MSDLTLRIVKNTPFPKLYEKFIKNDDFTEKEYEKILSLAIIFINSKNTNVQRLGYRIIVMFCNKKEHYGPLYEIAINSGLYPVAKFINDFHMDDDRQNIFTELNASFLELYKSGENYFSEEQYRLQDFYAENNVNSVSVVAPTSYGKTELIINTVSENSNKNICIITPTKSLLAQTRQRILNAHIDWVKKVVVHPEMYNANDEHCVAVLTQERVIRILKENPNLNFDYIVIDEAHDLIGGEIREELLAEAIIILNKRNPGAAFKFLTPFIKDSKSLKIRYTSYDLNEYMVKEYLKTEKIYLYDIRNNKGLLLYDQYMNEWYELINEPLGQTSIQFIKQHSSRKNIIYFNRPKDIERFAREMLEAMPDIQLSDDLAEAIEHISNYIDSDYNLVKCLKKGIIYHHGSIPDAIRSYIEYLYSNYDEIKYVITSSTLLEGVNLPANKLFIMDNKKGKGTLSASNFKNLIGRICRFGEIFSVENGSLKMLEPEIFLVFDKYYSKNANVKDYIKSVMKVDKAIKDEVKNVLLESTEILETNKDRYVSAIEYIENYEHGTIDSYENRYTQTKVGELCILNNVSEIDIFKHEEEISKSINVNGKLSSAEELLDCICDSFISFVKDSDNTQNLLRLKNEAAKKYYKMFLTWKIGNYPYSKMISFNVAYWRSLISSKNDTIIYAGKWGEEKRGGFRELWLDVSLKDQSELINLAIVRIKEEQDFIDNALMKFVEILNDMDLIEESLYLKIKYGTTDCEEIVLIKNGISLSLTNLLIEKYHDNIVIDLGNDTVTFSQELINKMEENRENKILIYEAQNNIF